MLLPKSPVYGCLLLKENEYLKNPERNPATAPILYRLPGIIDTPNALNTSFIQSPMKKSENSHPMAIPTNVASITFTKRVAVKTINMTIHGPIISGQL
jgi:hypothetical protein